MTEVAAPADRRARALLLPSERMPVAAALVLLAAVVVADTVTGEQTLLAGMLIIAPLLAAAFTRPSTTGVIGAAAVALAVVRVRDVPDLGELNGLVRVVTIAGGSLLAVLIAWRREQRERVLVEMTLVAEVAQQAVLWPVPERVGDLRLAARHVSATTAASIGGDLYEVVATPFGVRVVVGDVRGKGLGAVRMASAVLGSFRELAHTCPCLPELHRALDAAVARLAGPEDFVTAVLVELDSGQGRALALGHPAPVLLHDEQVRRLHLEEVGMPLGLGGSSPRPTPLVLPPGARLLLHTDGLHESRDADGRFFPVEQHLAALADRPPQELLDALLDRLRRHCGGGFGDDVALLLLEQG